MPVKFFNYGHMCRRNVALEVGGCIREMEGMFLKRFRMLNMWKVLYTEARNLEEIRESV